MMTVTMSNGEIKTFKNYQDFCNWELEEYKARKKKEEEARRIDREKKEASLSEADKVKISKLKEEIDKINLSTDFLDEIDRENIRELNNQIREIRGF